MSITLNTNKQNMQSAFLSLMKKVHLTLLLELSQNSEESDTGPLWASQVKASHLRPQSDKIYWERWGDKSRRWNKAVENLSGQWKIHS